LTIRGPAGNLTALSLDGNGTALTTYDPAKRSVATFTVRADPWPLIAGWALRHRFMPREPQTGNTKLFQKGSGLLTAPMRAQFTLDGQVMHVAAWLQISLFTRIFSLFMLPAEMPVNSGGFRAVVPRSMARKAVNELLEQVGAPPIR
jgi:hypothetical protein